MTASRCANTRGWTKRAGQLAVGLTIRALRGISLSRAQDAGSRPARYASDPVAVGTRHRARRADAAREASGPPPRPIVFQKGGAPVIRFW